VPVGPYGVAGHLGDVDGVLHVVGRRAGHGRDNVGIAAGHVFGDKAVHAGQIAQHAAGGAYLINNLAEGFIAQAPVAFPCLQVVQLGRFDFLEVRKNRIEIRV